MDTPVFGSPDPANNSSIWYRTPPITRVGRNVHINIVLKNLTVNTLNVYATGFPHPILPSQTSDYFLQFPVYYINTGECCGYGKLSHNGELSVYSSIKDYVLCQFSYGWYY